MTRRCWKWPCRKTTGWWRWGSCLCWFWAAVKMISQSIVWRSQTLWKIFSFIAFLLTSPPTQISVHSCGRSFTSLSFGRFFHLNPFTCTCRTALSALSRGFLNLLILNTFWTTLFSLPPPCSNLSQSTSQKMALTLSTSFRVSAA